MPDTIAEAGKLADEAVRKGGEEHTKVKKNVASVVLPSQVSETMSLSDTLKKAQVQTANANEKLDALCAAAELPKGESNVTLKKVRQERQDEVEAWKATTSHDDPTLAKLREEKSATVDPLLSKRDSAAARHHKLLALIRHVVKAREERDDKAVGTLVKFRIVYDDGRKASVELGTLRNGVTFGIG